MMEKIEIDVCPFRTYTQVRPSWTAEGAATVTDFMECLKGKCPAWYFKCVPLSGMRYAMKEYCKRLERIGDED